jgi:hypothetical protein
MSSAPTVVASAIPTNLDDDGTDRYSMGFASEGVDWMEATIKKVLFISIASLRNKTQVKDTLLLSNLQLQERRQQVRLRQTHHRNRSMFFLLERP